MKISELKNGEQIKARWLLKTCEVRKTSTKPPRDYLQVTLSDGTDDIKGMLWNYVNVGNLPQIGRAHNITAQVGEYNEIPQLTLSRIELADNQDMSDFLPDLGYDRQTLYEYAFHLIDHIEDPVLKSITKNIYVVYKNALLMAPAAKTVHHAGMGGLLKHSLETCEIAMGIFNNCTIVQLNMDLLIAGSLLHDIGKLQVYAYNDCLIETTDEGYLVEHIPLGIALLEGYKNAEGAEKILLLQHIIASHHGKLEFGSSVTPKFAEAYVINKADGISATLDQLKTANKKAKVGDRYTAKIYTLDNYPHLKQEIIADILKSRE